jgi:hypothetical protein
MDTRFYFQPDCFTIPTLSSLKKQWINVPDSSVRDVIALDNQYLAFHEYLLDSLKYENPWSNGALGLSTRAGAIKVALIVSASMVEAAMRSHAEKRNYKLPDKPNASAQLTEIVNIRATALNWRDEPPPTRAIDRR